MEHLDQPVFETRAHCAVAIDASSLADKWEEVILYVVRLIAQHANQGDIISPPERTFLGIVSSAKEYVRWLITVRIVESAKQLTATDYAALPAAYRARVASSRINGQLDPVLFELLTALGPFFSDALPLMTQFFPILDLPAARARTGNAEMTMHEVLQSNAQFTGMAEVDYTTILSHVGRFGMKCSTLNLRLEEGKASYLINVHAEGLQTHLFGFLPPPVVSSRDRALAHFFQFRYIGEWISAPSASRMTLRYSRAPVFSDVHWFDLKWRYNAHLDDFICAKALGWIGKEPDFAYKRGPGDGPSGDQDAQQPPTPSPSAPDAGRSSSRRNSSTRRQSAPPSPARSDNDGSDYDDGDDGPPAPSSSSPEGRRGRKRGDKRAKIV